MNMLARIHFTVYLMEFRIHESRAEMRDEIAA